MDQPLCANNCGFYGCAANKNLCSKCYKEFLKENITKSYDDESETKNSKVNDVVDVCKSVKKKNRCKSCNKKVGITGFECRCGDVFCGRHRYPELHSCNVNFKEIGRQALAKQNPMCIHEKLGSRV